MSITKRPISPKPSLQVADEFINRAPDASAASQTASPARKNKVQIALTIHPDLLAAIDALAQKKGLSRAGAISLACAELVEWDGK
jgi:hypothetical protein